MHRALELWLYRYARHVPLYAGLGPGRPLRSDCLMCVNSKINVNKTSVQLSQQRTLTVRDISKLYSHINYHVTYDIISYQIISHYMLREGKWKTHPQKMLRGGKFMTQKMLRGGKFMTQKMPREAKWMLQKMLRGVNGGLRNLMVRKIDAPKPM